MSDIVVDGCNRLRVAPSYRRFGTSSLFSLVARIRARRDTAQHQYRDAARANDGVMDKDRPASLYFFLHFVNVLVDVVDRATSTVDAK